MHRLPKVLIGIGVALVAVGALWNPIVVPRVVKLTDNIDPTDTYTGTFTTYLDAATGATLATPIEVPLTIDRHVVSVPGGTSADVALLHETATAHMGDRTVVQENVYAVNRRTMQNVADPRAWTFTPGNVIDRTGTYYVTLPMDLASSGEQLKIWKPEAGTSYDLVSTTPATGTAGGADVVNLKGNIPTPLPAASYEVASLQAQGLPMELTPAQAAAKLAASGVDAAALTPVLAASLTADELQTVANALAAPVPLHYYVYGSGLVGAEPTTGGLVALSNIVDGVAVAPDTTSMSASLAVLSKHTDVPAIASLVTTLQATIAAPPQPVYAMQYTQTPASVSEAGSYASSQADRVTLATTTIPRGLFGLGTASLLGAGWLVFRARRRATGTPEDVAPVIEHPAATAARHAA
jgi:hypothetical protein